MYPGVGPVLGKISSGPPGTETSTLKPRPCLFDLTTPGAWEGHSFLVSSLPAGPFPMSGSSKASEHLTKWGQGEAGLWTRGTGAHTPNWAVIGGCQFSGPPCNHIPMGRWLL